jgi:tetratricopeptide (TPR) repeat protein
MAAFTLTCRADVGDCPEVPKAFLDGAGPWDYRNPATRIDVRHVEGIHFTPVVESLRAGMTTAGPGGDITYLLTKVPNHTRGLVAFMNLVERTKMESPPWAAFTLECAFARAKAFAPDDPNVWALRGVYLSKTGHIDEALVEFKEANRLAPNNANVHYNLGLIYFGKKDYERARAHAKQAYELGFPLPGLKDKLVKAGEWDK